MELNPTKLLYHQDVPWSPCVQKAWSYHRINITWQAAVWAVCTHRGTQSDMAVYTGVLSRKEKKNFLWYLHLTSKYPPLKTHTHTHTHLWLSERDRERERDRELTGLWAKVAFTQTGLIPIPLWRTTLPPQWVCVIKFNTHQWALCECVCISVCVTPICTRLVFNDGIIEHTPVAFSLFTHTYTHGWCLPPLSIVCVRRSPHPTSAFLITFTHCMHDHILRVCIRLFQLLMQTVWFAPKHFTHLSYLSTKNKAAGFYNWSATVPKSQYDIVLRANNVLDINISSSQIW